jgi:hypothetical protein
LPEGGTLLAGTFVGTGGGIVCVLVVVVVVVTVVVVVVVVVCLCGVPDTGCEDMMNFKSMIR